MSDIDRVTTADGRVLTDAETAALAGIVKRLSWASLHWGVEDVHIDAWPHIAIAAVTAVREQVAAETAALVRALQAMCDDEWLRRRDRIMRLPGARYMRNSGSGEIEYAAYMVRSLIESLPDYDATATGGTYLDWMRNDRDEGTERIARGESS